MKRFYFFLTISFLAIFASLIATVLFTESAQEFFFNPAKEHIELDEPVKAIYLTTQTVISDRFDTLIDQLIESGGNAVVIDVEHSGGRLSFIPENEALKALNPGSDKMNLKELVKNLHDRGIYVIFRQVVFKDSYMLARNPIWRIKDKWGNYWGDKGNQWLDPSKPGAQNYNLMVLEELVKTGVDEVQFDYIRFPATQLWYLDFHYDESQFTRADIINDFLKKAKAITEEYEVKLAADVFGAVVWGNVDWKIVGQNIGTMSQHLDILSPMTYPSHYSDGYYGYYNIRTQPYAIVHDSIERFIARSNDILLNVADSEEETEAEPMDLNETEVRFWVQGFAWRAPYFGEEYIKEQIKASNDAGGKGFMIWNASNTYTQSWPTFNIQ